MARRSMREQISVAALDRFHARGYNASGIKDITDAAGVPKGSFYNHFDSKEAMAVEALRRYGATRRLADLADSSIAPLVRLRTHFEDLKAQTVGYGYARGCLLANFGTEVADHSETIRAGVAGAFARWTYGLATAVAEGQRDGTIAAGLDAEATGQFLLGAWEGAVIQARAQRSPAAFDAFFTTVFDVLLPSGSKPSR
jgi:TetR/AcrR family transcriptional repressor of nem operon